MTAPSGLQTPSDEPPPATWGDRWRSLVVGARRGHLGRLLVVAGVGVALGAGVGPATVPPAVAEARAAIEDEILPLVLDADGVWTSSSDELPAVAESLVDLRRDGETEQILASVEEWLATYDRLLLQLGALDLPAPAQPVQRQFVTAVTLTRDAVEVLGRAAELPEGPARQALATEVGRLRTRSEQLTQAARASTVDLGGGQTDVDPFPDLTTFDDARED